MVADPAHFASDNDYFTRFGDWCHDLLAGLVLRRDAFQVPTVLCLSERKNRSHARNNLRPKTSIDTRNLERPVAHLGANSRHAIVDMNNNN